MCAPKLDIIVEMALFDPESQNNTITFFVRYRITNVLNNKKIIKTKKL